MKECNVAATIVLLLALSLVVTLSVGLGLTLANENNGNSGLPELQKPAPVSLHYAAEANVAQATMKADIAKLLNVPAGAELSIIGTADLETSGKYVFICTWSGGEPIIISTPFSRTLETGKLFLNPPSTSKRPSTSTGGK